MSDAATRAWTAMRSLVLELHDRRSAVAEETGMSFLRVKALGKLLPGPLPMRELAARLLVDAPYTTVLVDDLEERGLVRREANPADRRSKLVHVTDAGRELAARAHAVQSQPPAPMRDLDGVELERLAAVLEQLVARSQDAAQPGAEAASTSRSRPA